MVLTDEDRRLLDRPAYARMATLMPDGAPQITVLWYRREGNELRVVCPQSAQKVRNIDRDARVSVVIEEPQNAHAFVELRGEGEVIRDDQRARSELRSIAARYIGDEAEAFVGRLSADPRVVLAIRPERVIRHGI